MNINPDGTPGQRGWYTAASKESLHIGMLALAVDLTPLAYNFLPGATSPEEGRAAAVERLESIIGAYEQFNLDCPGCGGFLPWIGTSDTGFAVPNDGTAL